MKTVWKIYVDGIERRLSTPIQVKPDHAAYGHLWQRLTLLDDKGRPVEQHSLPLSTLHHIFIMGGEAKTNGHTYSNGDV